MNSCFSGVLLVTSLTHGDLFYALNSSQKEMTIGNSHTSLVWVQRNSRHLGCHITSHGEVGSQRRSCRVISSRHLAGHCLKTPKMFLSSNHTRSLFCPQEKDRRLMPPLLPNRLSSRRSMPAWLKSTSWGCWRRKSAWKLQHNSKTWRNKSPRMLLTWKPSAPTMYVSACRIHSSTGHRHSEN